MRKKHRVLILAYTKDQVDRVIPLLKELKKEAINETVVAGLGDSAQRELQKKNMPHKTSQDYLTKESHEKAIAAARSLAKNWYVFKTDRAFSDLVSYDGISLGNMVEFDFSLSLVEVMEGVEVLRCIIDNEKPDEIILVDDNDPIRKAAIPVGRAYNIPTSVIRPNIFDLNYHLLGHFLPWFLKYVKPYVVMYFNLGAGFNRSHWRKTKYKLEEPTREGINSILALTYWRPDINKIIIPVIKKLEEDNKNRVMVLGLSEASKRQLEQESIPYQTFGDYSNNEIDKKVSDARKLLAKKWQGLKGDKEFRESLTYLNIPLWGLVEEKFSTLYSATFIQIVKYIETVNNLIKTENIDAIVVASDHRATEKTTVTVGNALGIPTLVIQHGVLSTPQLILPVTASKMAVMGKIPRDQFVDLGEAPGRLVVTGSPKYDFLSHRAFDKEKICHKLNLDGSKNIIVLTTQNSPKEENETLLRGVLQAMGDLPDVQLVIKPHPVEDEGFHRSLVKELGTSHVVITKSVALYELLNACDALMTVSSTTALEAMMLGKPVVIINLTGRRELVPYVKSGAALGVYQLGEIITGIKKLLYDQDFRKELEEKRRKFVYEYAYKMNGRASKRVAELIGEMIGESTSK